MLSLLKRLAVRFSSGFHLTRKSSNKKTGDIAVTTSTRDNCPDTCALKGTGCYADSGPLALHWNKVTNGERGTDLGQHIRDIKALPPHTPLRLNQAGELPSNGETLDREATTALLAAAGAHGRAVTVGAWTYTHYKDPNSLDVLRAASGAVVNLSADTLTEVDALPKDLPIAVTTPSMDKVQRTPGGFPVILCPAQSMDGVSCAGGKDTRGCGGNGLPLCARKDRAYAIGFYPHGNRARKVKERLLQIGGTA